MFDKAITTLLQRNQPTQLISYKQFQSKSSAFVNWNSAFFEFPGEGTAAYLRESSIAFDTSPIATKQRAFQVSSMHGAVQDGSDDVPLGLWHIVNAAKQQAFEVSSMRNAV
eukprot:COSAG02_NODE_292_length_25466_cov_5.070604_9_plen_111_part_00